jgi:hypothetical protein
MPGEVAAVGAGGVPAFDERTSHRIPRMGPVRRLLAFVALGGFAIAVAAGGSGDAAWGAHPFASPSHVTILLASPSPAPGHAGAP